MRRYTVFLISVPVALVCARLGFWQLARLHDRRARNAEQRAFLALPPVELRGAAGEPEVFRSVRGTGRFDYRRQIVIEGAEVRGVPAMVVVTPLVLGDGSAVLVDRGWVPSGSAPIVLEALNEADSLAIEGAVVDPGPAIELQSSPDSVWPKHLQRPTPASLGSLYPYRLRPYLVRRTGPAPEGKVLRMVPLPELSDGPHLGYVVQWWSFALIVMVGSVFLYRRDGKGR